MDIAVIIFIIGTIVSVVLVLSCIMLSSEISKDEDDDQY